MTDSPIVALLDAAAAQGLDPDRFDRQERDDLREFLAHVRDLQLTRDEVVEEATLWRRLLADGVDAAEVVAAVDLLATLPPADEATPPEPIAIEPANELERALAAVAASPGARPRLWRAIHESDIVLPVVDHDVRPGESLHLQFLVLPDQDRQIVLGFATEERLDDLLPDGPPLSRVTPPGRDLPGIWPAGHWLLLNFGYAGATLLPPWEITGLPAGGVPLPHPDDTELRRPDPGDTDAATEAAIARAVALGAGQGEAWWLQVRGPTATAETGWHDVVVVASADPDGVAARLPDAVVVHRHAGRDHPLVELVVEEGHHLRVRRQP